MKPIEFKGANVVFAKDQPEYLQLPAFKDDEGNVITEWELTDRERLKIFNGENLRLSLLTFNQPLQPVRPYLVSELHEDEKKDKGKKKSAFSEEVCGEKKVTMYDSTEAITCECGKKSPLEFSQMNQDGIWSCPSCVESFLQEKLEKAYARINRLKNSGYPNESVETEITKISNISTGTDEGKLLMAAIAKITGESQTDKTPDEVLDQLQNLKNVMYPTG